MTKTFLKSLSPLLILPGALFAQSNTVFGSGYSAPTPIPAAPGQVLNLLVQGIGGKLTQRVAVNTFPLPTTLAGIAVTLKQSLGMLSVPVPILAVDPLSTCVNVAAPAECGMYTAVTVEVPFELVPNLQGPASLIQNAAQFVVSENGVPGGAVNVSPLTDQIHVLNTCDLNTGPPVPCFNSPVITHGNGTLVSFSNPAEQGEELIMYAFGLGLTTPLVPTGDATPLPGVPTQGMFRFNFDFRPNVTPSKPPFFPIVCEAIRICPYDSLFAGLTAGYVGLYQANFVVPSIPPGTTPIDCSGAVTSNLTVTLYALSGVSFDGAGICVDMGGGEAPL